MIEKKSPRRFFPGFPGLNAEAHQPGRAFLARRPPWQAYAFAVGVTAATLLIRVEMGEMFASRLTLILFILPIILSAYTGGLGPGLVATFLAAASAKYYLIPPVHGFQFARMADLAQWAILIINGAIISVLSEALRRLWRQTEVSRVLHEVTLSSIGDAIIATDIQGRIGFLNPEAERLTGLMQAEAAGQSLPAALRIVNERTREPVAVSITGILESGMALGLSHGAVLLGRDGRESAIEINGAPIRLGEGAALGAVLVFRDCSEERKARSALRESEEHYRSLFDNMLNGFAYCRMHFDPSGPSDFTYLNVNAAFASLTGLKNVIGKRVSEVIPGIRTSDPRLFERCGRVALTGRPERFETYIESLKMWFSISLYSPQKEYFVAIFDVITERKQAEEARETTVELLRLCNQAGSSRELMRGLLAYFRGLTGCEAAGVRLREGDDFPYFETRGFSEEFVRLESRLCAKDAKGELIRDETGHPVLDCMCGNILSGRFDPAKPFFSPRGSFWSSGTTELLATTTDADRKAKTRNRCNGEGYESVALIPLRTRGETFGLFQFNDRRKGRFTPEKIAQLEDLTEYVAITLAKLKSEEALRESGRFSQQVINSAEEGVIVYGPDLRYQVWNPFMEQLDGLRASEVLGRHPLELFPFLRETGMVERLQKTLAGETPPAVEFPYRATRGGRSGWVSQTCAPLRNTQGEIIGVIATIRDVTEKKQAADSLRTSLEEKVALLDEVHHRVKNNLQIVASLLNLQANRVKSREVAEELRDTCKRVRSMALLHEVLYRSGNLARINFAVYVDALCKQLLRSFGPAAARVRIENRAARIGLPLEKSVPCGLIINELVSNALKHAFPGERPGSIIVEVVPAAEKRLDLLVCDDGVGLSAGLDLENPSTLGLHLVSNLAAQLGGELTAERGKTGGAVFRISFPFDADTLPGGEG